MELDSRHNLINRIVLSYNAALSSFKIATNMLDNYSQNNDGEAFIKANECGNHLYTAVETTLRIIITDNGMSLDDDNYKSTTTFGLCVQASRANHNLNNIDLACLVIEKDKRNVMTHKSALIIELSGFIRVFQNLYRLITLIDSKIILEYIGFMEENIDFSYFFEELGKFQDEDTTYMLITDPIHDMPKEYLKLFLKPHWDIIIDFDGRSRNGGLRSNLDAGKLIVEAYIDDLKTSGFQTSAFGVNKTVWLYMEKRGYFTPSVYRDWSIERKKNLEYFIKSAYESKMSKIIVVCLKKYDGAINDLVVRLKDNFTDIKIIFANQNSSNISERIEENLNENQYSIHDCSLYGVLASFSEHKSQFEHLLTESNVMLDGVIVPSREETKELEPNLKINLEDYFEIVHLGLGKEFDNIDQEKERFLKGEEIPWSIFQYKIDVLPIKQKKYVQFISEIQEVLKVKVENQSQKIFKLIHRPGFGGTVLSRRIAWDLHSDFPVIRLKKYKFGAVGQQIASLYDYCNKGVFIFADESDISEADLEEFEREIKNLDRPVAALIVKRFYDGNFLPRNQDNLLVLSVLEDTSIEMLSVLYKSLAEKKHSKASLNMREHNMSNILTQDMRCPFIIGLYYLEDDFIGVKDYVGKFVSQLIDHQAKKALLSIALVDYFGRIKMPSYMLERLFNASNTFNLKDHLFGSLELLVKGIDDKNKTIFWRPKHYLISQEIIKWLSSDDNYSNNWHEKLAIHAKEITDLGLMCCKNSVPEIIREIMSDIFIYNRSTHNQKQDRHSEEGTFSVIIDLIPFKEQKREVLEYVTNKFNEIVLNLDITSSKNEYYMVAHFWGHLARFYSKEDINFPEAEKCCFKALSIMDSIGAYSSSLYHIYGDCISKKIDVFCKGLLENGQFLENIAQVQDMLDEATEYFNKSKQGNQEYGILSHIQMLIQFLRRIFQAKKIGSISDLRNLSDPWIHKYINDLNDLFFELEKDGISEKSLAIYEACEREFHTLLYKKSYGEIIQDLNNYLDRLYISPVKDWRRIYEARKILIHSILSKYDNDFVKLSDNPKDVERILELLNSNIEGSNGSVSDFSMWLRIAKYSNESSDNALIIARKWHNKVMEHGKSKDPMPAYYIYILNILRALEGFPGALDEANKYRKECMDISQSIKSYRIINISKIRDWFGYGVNLKKLIDDNTVTYSNVAIDDRIAYVIGEIINCNSYETAGLIRVLEPYQLAGLEIFFKPSESGLGSNQINHRVRLKFGFSFERPVAFNKSIEDLDMKTNKRVKDKNTKKVNENLTDIKENQTVDIKITRKATHSKILFGEIVGTRITGGVPYSEIKHGYIKDEEALSYIGRTLQAKVIKIDYLQNRYTLSIKQSKGGTDKVTIKEVFENTQKYKKRNIELF